MGRICGDWQGPFYLGQWISEDDAQQVASHFIDYRWGFFGSVEYDAKPIQRLWKDDRWKFAGSGLFNIITLCGMVGFFKVRF